MVDLLKLNTEQKKPETEWFLIYEYFGNRLVGLRHVTTNWGEAIRIFKTQSYYVMKRSSDGYCWFLQLDDTEFEEESTDSYEF